MPKIIYCVLKITYFFMYLQNFVYCDFFFVQSILKEFCTILDIHSFHKKSLDFGLNC
jgi:hypothetical protein